MQATAHTEQRAGRTRNTASRINRAVADERGEDARDLQGQPIWWCRCGETFKNGTRLRVRVALNSVGVGSQRIKCAGAALLAALCGLVVITLPARWVAVSLAIFIALRVCVVDVAQQRPTSGAARVTMPTSPRLRRANQGHVDYDASTAPCLRAFGATKAQTVCPFASRATLWGGHHTPGASLEQNVAASVRGTMSKCHQFHLGSASPGNNATIVPHPVIAI